MNRALPAGCAVAMLLVCGPARAQAALEAGPALRLDAQAPEASAAPETAEEPAPRERPPWATETTLETVDEPPPSSARTNLLLTGSAVTLGFYGIGFGTSYLWPQNPAAEDLRIPVVGAYSAVFGSGCGNGERGCTTLVAVLRTAFATLSALGQTGGLLMIGEGIFMDTTSSSTAVNTSPHSDGFAPNAASGSLEAGDPPPPAAPPARATSPLYYAPIVDEHSFGLSIGGTF